MAIPYSTPTTVVEYQADNTWLAAQIASAKTAVASQTTQIAALKSQITTLQSAIGAAQAKQN